MQMIVPFKNSTFYVAALSIYFLSFSQEKAVILGDSQRSCCDLTDTNGNSSCATKPARSRRSTDMIVHGLNRPLANGANYSYYIITATPVRTTSGSVNFVYANSAEQIVSYHYSKLNLATFCSQRC